MWALTDFKKWVAALIGLAVSLTLLAVVTAALHLEYSSAASHRAGTLGAKGAQLSSSSRGKHGTETFASLMDTVREFLSPTPPDGTAVGLSSPPQGSPADERRKNLHIMKTPYPAEEPLKWSLGQTQKAVTRALLGLSAMEGARGGEDDAFGSSDPKSLLQPSVDEGVVSAGTLKGSDEPCGAIFGIPKVRENTPVHSSPALLQSVKCIRRVFRW
jgi:hypothetical protein